MNTAALKASLALWRRRLAYRERKLASVRTKAHKGGIVTAAEAEHIHKWERLAREARDNVARRVRQLAEGPSPSVRQKAVAHALAYAGTKENPPGSNRGGIITVWQRALADGGSWLVGQAWCGTFLGNMLRWSGVKGVNSRIAGVALIEDDARAGRAPYRGWSSGFSPRGVLPGDLVVLFGRGVHVEMVREVGSNYVKTVGGNTSSGPGGSQSNGGGVFARTRSASVVHGFAKVNYPG